MISEIGEGIARINRVSAITNILRLSSFAVYKFTGLLAI